MLWITSRITFLWYYIILAGLLVGMEALRQYVLVHMDYNFEVHVVYSFFYHFFITAIVANTVNLIAHEIRMRFTSRHLMVRKILPLAHFLALTLVWIVGLIYFTKNLNVDINGFLTGAGIGGALFLLGAKDVFANFLGTLSIVMSHMFEIGDHVSAGDRLNRVEGIVEEITLNFTKITNMEGMVVYIPNRTLLSEKFENISRRRYFVPTWKIVIPAEIPSDTVREILEKIERKVEEYYPRALKRELTDTTTAEYTYTLSAEGDSENRDFSKEIELFIMKMIEEARKMPTRRTQGKKKKDGLLEEAIRVQEA